MFTIKIKKSFFQILGIILSLICMFKIPYAVTEGVTSGLQTCFYVILPSLFPFIVLSNYIIKSNILGFTYKVFSPISRLLFRQPPMSIPVIIMSMIGGFPVGIKMVDALKSNGEITNNQALRLCLFCMNGGPAFIINAVGVNMLNSSRAGIIIYVSLCISSLILGIITSFLGDKNELKKEYKVKEQSTPISLSSAVGESLQSILGICAWVVIFGAITSCLKVFIENKVLYYSLSALLEVINGCVLSVGKIPLPIITLIIGFGGICVHCQVMQNLRECGLKYSHFLVCRILNGAIASLISYLLFLVFPVETNVFASTDNITANAFSVSLPAFCTFTIMCIIMIFDIDRKKKMW